MSFRVTIEHQPSTGIHGILLPVGSASAERLQTMLGTSARVLSAVDEGDQEQPVVIEYDLGSEGGFASHDQVVDFVAPLIEQAGLYAVRAVVAEVVRHYVAGAVISGAAALGITKDMNPWVAVLATGLAAAIGGVAGGRVEQEVARFEAHRHPYRGWTWYECEPRPALGWAVRSA